MITCPVKYGMNILIHSETSTVQPLKFGNALVIRSFMWQYCTGGTRYTMNIWNIHTVDLPYNTAQNYIERVDDKYKDTLCVIKGGFQLPISFIWWEMIDKSIIFCVKEAMRALEFVTFTTTSLMRWVILRYNFSLATHSRIIVLNVLCLDTGRFSLMSQLLYCHRGKFPNASAVTLKKMRFFFHIYKTK